MAETARWSEVENWPQTWQSLMRLGLEVRRQSSRVHLPVAALRLVGPGTSCCSPSSTSRHSQTTASAPAIGASPSSPQTTLGVFVFRSPNSTTSPRARSVRSRTTAQRDSASAGLGSGGRYQQRRRSGDSPGAVRWMSRQTSSAGADRGTRETGTSARTSTAAPPPCRPPALSYRNTWNLPPPARWQSESRSVSHVSVSPTTSTSPDSSSRASSRNLLRTLWQFVPKNRREGSCGLVRGARRFPAGSARACRCTWTATGPGCGWRRWSLRRGWGEVAGR